MLCFVILVATVSELLHVDTWFFTVPIGSKVLLADGWVVYYLEYPTGLWVKVMSPYTSVLTSFFFVNHFDVNVVDGSWTEHLVTANVEI